MATATALTTEEREAALDREVERYVRRGFRVVARTATTAQLVKPKRFSWFWFAVWVLLLVGWIFYLAWYWTRRDEQVYLEALPDGTVRRTKR